MSNSSDAVRKQSGFYSSDEVIELIGSHNTILDSSSVLIGESVVVGKGNIFYPNVIIQCDKGGHVEIGEGNTFYPGTLLLCIGGSVVIGDNNTFGPAGFTTQANGESSIVTIGSGGRYANGANIISRVSLGDGSQILGSITAQDCDLAAGGGFGEPDPDKRGAVLKGFGVARGLDLKIGQVVNGSGDFSKAAIEWQHSYHPKPIEKMVKQAKR